MIRFNTSLKDELRQFAIIAIPLSAAYLAEFAMFLTTKMVVGKLGYHSLAAVGIAGDLTFEVLVVLMALLSIVGVLAAQALGAGKKMELGDSVRQGFFVATGLGVPAMIIIWNLDLALIATGQDPMVIELARDYLIGISGAVLPVLWFSVFRNFVAVLSQTVSILVISVIAVALNYGLTLWFVYGGFGLNHWACSARAWPPVSSPGLCSWHCCCTSIANRCSGVTEFSRKNGSCTGPCAAKSCGWAGR